MPGGTFLTTTFPKLYYQRLAYIDELVGPEDWDEVDNQWEQFFDVQDSDRVREQILEHAGFGLFNSMAENEAVTYDAMVQGPHKNFTHTLYGLGFTVGFLAAQNDLDGIIKRNAPELGRSLRMSVQTLAAGFWNTAWTTETTADGQYVFDSDHTYIRGGGTFSNLASAALSHSALETGIVKFRQFKDLMGNPMPMKVDRLLIPPDLEPITHELLQSRMRHDTTTHADSFLTGKVTPVSWPFFTLTTGWALMAPSKDLMVKWYWNVRPMTDHGYDFDKSAAKTKTLFACSYGAVDPRGLYGYGG